MTITEDMLTEIQGQQIETITFKQLIEEICGVPFEEVYPDYLMELKND